MESVQSLALRFLFKIRMYLKYNGWTFYLFISKLPYLRVYC